MVAESSLAVMWEVRTVLYLFFLFMISSLQNAESVLKEKIHRKKQTNLTGIIDWDGTHFQSNLAVHLVVGRGQFTVLFHWDLLWHPYTELSLENAVMGLH